MALLEIGQLKKTFIAPDGEPHRVIDVASFALTERDQVALSGVSGSGKPTLLNLIAGILTPDSGTIRIDGREMTTLKESQRDRLRATTIGYIFQTSNLLQGYTCLENVLLGMSFGPGVNRDFAIALLQRVGLGDRLKHYPRQLSTGQQQRVAVARALAKCSRNLKRCRRSSRSTVRPSPRTPIPGLRTPNSRDALSNERGEQPDARFLTRQCARKQ